MDTAFGTPPWLDNRAEDFQNKAEGIKEEVLNDLGDLYKLGERTLEENIDYADIISDTIAEYTSNEELRDAIYDDITQEMNDLGW
jgi:hypothetical protein